MDTLVVTTVLVAVGSTEAKRIVNKQSPSFKAVLGGFILGVFLFTFNGINETFTRYFCILLIVGSLLINGTQLFNAFSSVAGIAPTPPSKATAGSQGKSGFGASGSAGGGGGGGGGTGR